MSMVKDNQIKSLDIPKEVLSFITPEDRKAVFMYLIKDYQRRFSNLKLQFAYINTDSSSPIDFLLLFSTKSVDGMDMIVFDVPVIYSDRSLPGFRYCKSLGKEMTKKYYNYALDNMTRMEKTKFDEFIIHAVNLSTNPISPKYWKKEKYAKDVAEKLFDLSMLYKKPGE